jgi:acyl-CoA hydrolase/GNAT superfamily N-acetyltransferase
MDLTEIPSGKVVDAQTAISKINNGSRVFVGTGCGEPQHLIRALAEAPDIQDIMVYQMLSWTFADYMDDPTFLDRFSLKLFFINNSIRQATYEGKIDYIPTFLSQIPRYFASHRIGLDVALVQVSPPDKYGYCSLGVSVDITLAGVQNAKLVIAQINPCMPKTWGDSFVHIEDIDYFVEHKETLVQTPTSTKDRETVNRIGFYVNQLVEDGSTLQIGFGHLPNTILQHLMDKNDLGIHTHLITDDFLPLFVERVVTNRKKSLLQGRTVASLCMGTEPLYNYVNDNPLFYFRSSEFVNDPTVIARNDRLISISSALEIDLTGQVCSDSMNHLFYSGIGDQVDFLRGSAMSKGGFSVVAFPSTARNGKFSRIVPHLNKGAGVATTRGDVDFVVTEYGIAELSGKSIYQRVMELAQIAHPKFREELIDVAKSRHYIFADQLPPVQEDLIFIEGYKSRKTLRNGKVVDFRPLLPSDEFAYRNFFYSLKEETIYFRFFYRMKLFSHEVIQQQWAEVDYRKNMSMIGLVRIGGRQEIVAIGSYADESDSVAEVAFVVREDYQGFGIASYLLAELEKIAKENHFKGFAATVLRENAAMLHVFKKGMPTRKSVSAAAVIFQSIWISTALNKLS